MLLFCFDKTKTTRTENEPEKTRSRDCGRVFLLRQLYQKRGGSMYVNFNPNPDKAQVGDCTVRAISKAINKSWDDTYIGLALQGFRMKDMPSSNRVWGEYLYDHGFRRFIIPDSCPNCYTIKDFCNDHKNGKFILATGTHVVCAMNGNYYDSWDSGDEVPIYYWRKEVNTNGI